MSDEAFETIKHVVAKNETLVGIALKYGMRVDQLKKLNRLFANNTFEGQVLNVKVKKESAEALSTSPPPPVTPSSTDPTSPNTLLPSKSMPNVPILSSSPAISLPASLSLLSISSGPSHSTFSMKPSSSSSSIEASLADSTAPTDTPALLIDPAPEAEPSLSTAFPPPSSQLLSPSGSTKLKLSTSVPNRSYLDLINTTGGSSTDPAKTKTEIAAPSKHKRSEVWNLLGITKPHEVVNCYAKYIPVHGEPVLGMLTITPTRVIFEPNLDDPGVAKDGVLAHQFSVETGRLLEVETFSDDVTFGARLAKQLEDQAQWDVPRPRPRKASDAKPRKEGKPDKPKKVKKSKSKTKMQDPVIHFDPTSEEMLQIVCSGRFRPKNYANFILPKEKGDVIYQHMVRFLSGSKEERLKAYLNLDVSTPPPKAKLLRRSLSSSRLPTLRHSAGDESTPLPQEAFVKKDRQLAPKLKKEKSKTEERIVQDIEAARRKKQEAKSEAEQAKLLKEQQKKEKKALKELANSEKRRPSISEKWRSRKGVSTSDVAKSPTLSAKSPASPTTPPASPLFIVDDIPASVESSMPALDITDKRPSSDLVETPPPVSSSDLAEEEAGFLPALRDESLIFSEKDMHQLRRYLPGYTKWMDWRLLYSTQVHGISFSTFLYRTKYHTPTLFVMEDSNGFVFGGYATAPWAVNTGYFGSGQSFLFSLKPKLHVYEWTRANNFFMYLTPEAIAMGGDKEGRHGFRIDTNFEFGTSEVCSTFFNRCLASTERFKCTIVEVWTFTDSKVK